MKLYRRNPDPVYDEEYKKMIRDAGSGKSPGFRIRLSLKPDGDITIGVEGIKGKTCEKVAENVIAEMGIVKESEVTAEFFEQPKVPVKEKEIILPQTGTTVVPGLITKSMQEGPSPAPQSQKEKAGNRRFNPLIRKRNPYHQGYLRSRRNPWRLNPESYRRFNRKWY